MPLESIAFKEILLNIAGYLSNTDIKAFRYALPNFERITDISTLLSFQPWQRRLEEFTTAADAAYEAIDKEKKRMQKLTGPVSASTLNLDIPEVCQMEDNVFPQMLQDMEIPLSDSKVLLDAVFLSLLRLGNFKSGSKVLRSLLEPDTEEASLRLRAALEVYVPIKDIVKLLPSPIPSSWQSIPFQVQDRILVTGYLLFSKLRPQDIIHLLPRTATNGYISESAVAEYFSYLLLFLRVFHFDNVLWMDILYSTKDPATDRVRWVYMNGSPVSGAGLKALRKRIEDWFRTFHEPPILVSTDPKQSVLTREQQKFVDTDIGRGEIFKVRAFAGTGKTKCLVDYAQKRPRKKILYVAYNRQAKLDSELRFQRCYNVDCKTIHSVAYSALGIVNPEVNRQVKGKPRGASTDAASQGGSSRRGTLARIESAPAETPIDLRHWDMFAVIKVLDLSVANVAKVFTTPYEWPTDPLDYMRKEPRRKIGSKSDPKNPENLARVVTTAIDHFCNSNDSEPLLRHLSMDQCRKKMANPLEALVWVQKFWDKIIAGESTTLKHDCYLKMFSISTTREADRATFGQYDIVMFDEAQDANPCMANIILRQKSTAGIILIGDPYQMIYGFRGARNECFDDSKHPPTRTFHLTNSFRFGPEVADVANLILGTLDEKKKLRGRKPDVPTPGVFYPPVPNELNPPPQIHTVIFRTNSELVQHFFAAFAQNNDRKMFLRTSSDDAAESIIPLLRAGYYLYLGRPMRPQHRRLRGLNTYSEAKYYHQREEKAGAVGHLDDDEIDMAAIDLIVGMERFYEKATDEQKFLDMLTSSADAIVNKEIYADIVLTTAHQAKGLEWDDVIIADDFQTTGLSTINITSDQEFFRESVNLLYVAVTRAKKRLQVSRGLQKFMKNYIGSSRFFLTPPPPSPSCSENYACPCCKGKGPRNSFLSMDIKYIDEQLGVDTTSYLNSREPPCVGYELILPPRDATAMDGWVDPYKKPPNPLQMPKSVFLNSVACIDCIITWRYCTNRTNGDIFRFAEGIKGRLGGSSFSIHGDCRCFWLGRFANLHPQRLVDPERYSLQEAYFSGLRKGKERVENVGSAYESDEAWADSLFEKAKEAGVEYDDDDLDDYLMALDE